MRQTRILMGMPVTVQVGDSVLAAEAVEAVYAYFTYVDETFSTYKESSEISRINAGRLAEAQWSADMRSVMTACQQTKVETGGYFDISRNGRLDPSGYVKGWAIQNAAALLDDMNLRDYYVDAGGDIQAAGLSESGQP